MSEEAIYRSALQRQHIALVRDLEVEDVLHHLLVEDAITDEQYQAVLSEVTAPDKARHLLQLMRKKGATDIKHLITALGQCQPHLKVLLNNDITQQKAQRKSVPVHKRILEKLSTTLVKDMFPKSVVDRLFAFGYIDDENVHEITTSPTPNPQLLKMLKIGPHDMFIEFVSALRRENKHLHTLCVEELKRNSEAESASRHEQETGQLLTVSDYPEPQQAEKVDGRGATGGNEDIDPSQAQQVNESDEHHRTTDKPWLSLLETISLSFAGSWGVAINGQGYILLGNDNKQWPLSMIKIRGGRVCLETSGAMPEHVNSYDCAREVFDTGEIVIRNNTHDATTHLLNDNEWQIREYDGAFGFLVGVLPNEIIVYVALNSGKNDGKFLHTYSKSHKKLLTLKPHSGEKWSQKISVCGHPKVDIIGVTESNTEKLYFYSYAGKLLTSIQLGFKPRGYHAMACDRNHVYVSQYDPAAIHVYSWSGDHVTCFQRDVILTEWTTLRAFSCTDDGHLVTAVGPIGESKTHQIRIFEMKYTMQG